MSLFTFESSHKIPAEINRVWEFISSPKNLKDITPDYMGFDILSQNLPEKMYPGMIISYHVRPLLGIKMLWVTEITQMIKMEFFVDEQRIGPYRFWHHQHRFKTIPEGVLIEDIVSYSPPYGFLG
jgi:ligand-binding SRPBCC domain-containing protein